MKLSVKTLPLKTERLSVVLNQDDAEDLGILPGDRVKILVGRESFIAEVETSTEIIKKGEIGLDTFTAESCNLNEQCKVEIHPVERPESVEFIRKKFEGKKYKKDEMKKIVSDIASNILNDIELAAFILANEIVGLDTDEIEWITWSMYESGERISFERGNVVDSSSIGSVLGNRYAMVTVPTVAAAGLLIPKTASRAITSASGTADTMEVLADVNLSVDEIKEIVEKVGGVIAWGGATNIAPADDKILRMEHQLGITSKACLISSLLAKKLGIGAKYVVVDIPISEEAKIENLDEGRNFASLFVEVGRRVGLKLSILISDGTQPLCKAVGPALEAREVLRAMENKEENELVEKGLEIASMLMEYGGIENSNALARKIFESGKTLEKFKEIIAAQGGDEKIKSEDIPVGEKRYTVNAGRGGIIQKISIKAINEIARAAGAPKDKGAGVYIHKKRGEVVKVGEPILTIYAEKDWKLDKAIEVARRENPIIVSGMVLEVIRGGVKV
ncbi:MAG: AMP phosphorylase [Archaeoglobaceae archaeon]